MKYYIGVDPGKTGAIAVITEDKKVTHCAEMPLTGTKALDITRLNRIFNFNPYDQAFCIIEKAQSMPGNGGKAMFSYGYSYGLMIGFLVANSISFQEIKSPRWKKEFSLIGKTKGASCDVASKLFPSQTFITPRGRMLDGMAEALLMAEYGRRLKW